MGRCMGGLGGGHQGITCYNFSPAHKNSHIQKEILTEGNQGDH